MKCQKCNFENNMNNRYCANCGSVLQNKPSSGFGKQDLMILGIAGISILLFILIIVIIGVFTSSGCNEHYTLDEKTLEHELGKYEIVDQYDEHYDPIGLECRTKTYVSVIKFYDKYNNKIIFHLDNETYSFEYDSDKEEALEQVALVQLINSKFNNIFYLDDDDYPYSIHFKDSKLDSNVDVYFFFMDSLHPSGRIVDFDISDTDYVLEITLNFDEDANIDKQTKNNIVRALYAADQHVHEVKTY